MAHDTNNPTPTNLPPATYAPRPPRLRRPPFWMVSIGLISVVASWILLVLAARGRVIPSDQPRVQFVQDMGSQPKFREQQSNAIFADGRADRLPVPGTVARGRLEADDHYYRGYTMGKNADGKPAAKFDDDFPEQVKLTPALLKRGQERFGIYCAPCHGNDGQGNGPVAARAIELKESKWTPPASIPGEPARSRPVGHLYNTVNVGIRAMPGYGAQVGVEDRWAIVAYVRALQLAQNAPANLTASTGSAQDKQLAAAAPAPVQK